MCMIISVRDVEGLCGIYAIVSWFWSDDLDPYSKK